MASGASIRCRSIAAPRLSRFGIGIAPRRCVDQSQAENPAAARRATVRAPQGLEQTLRRFAREAGEYLCSNTRSEIPLEFRFAALEGRAEISAALSGTGWAAAFPLLGGRGAVAFDPALAFHLVDASFGGGAGAIPSGPIDRLVSDIDALLLREHAMELVAILGRLLTDPVPASLFPGRADRELRGHDSGAWLARFGTGSAASAVTLLLPPLPELSDGAGRAPGDGTAAVTGLLGARVRLSVSVGDVHATLSRLSLLEIGDVLPVTTHAGGKLVVSVEGVPKFLALPASAHGLRSARIVSRGPSDSGEDRR